LGILAHFQTNELIIIAPQLFQPRILAYIKAGELIMKPIREAYEAHVMKIFKGKAQFLVSGLDGASAAVLGASAIGWEIQ
jgi:hypothetical protein